MDKKVRIITLGTSHGDPGRERFNTSTLLDIPGYGGILIDAGTPVLALLIRNGYAPENLQAVCITHMHQDHFGGLPDILKYWVKRLPPERKLKIFLPEKAAMSTIFAFTELAHREIPRERFEIYEISAGDVISGGDMHLRAIATDHFSNERKNYPSWAFLFENHGKRVLFTGDLAADFHDFPSGNITNMTFCELTHFKLETALPVLQKEKFGELIFTHVGDQWQNESAGELFEKMTEILPYPAKIAHDGEIFLL